MGCEGKKSAGKLGKLLRSRISGIKGYFPDETPEDKVEYINLSCGDSSVT
jgi:hypothetical protein